MERNVHFETAGLTDIAVRLAWAQLEVFADDVEKIQVLAAGDESTVKDLRIVQKENALVVEQPQYGLSLNIMEGHWMQVCIRVPRTWEFPIHLNTISGLMSAHGLCGSQIVMDTVSGDMHARRLNAEKIILKTISGDVRGEQLTAKDASARSVSGSLTLDGLSAGSLKCNSVSGAQIYNFVSAFHRIEIGAVSGDVMITSPLDKVNVSLRSISGRIRTQGVTLTEDEDAPKIRVTGVSAELKLACIQE